MTSFFFQLTKYALHLILLGNFAPTLLSPPLSPFLFSCLTAIGIILLGQHFATDAVLSLTSQRSSLLSFLHYSSNSFVHFLLGFLFTVFVQSSGTTVGLVITLLSGGSIDLRTGSSIMFGANVGTAISSIYASQRQSVTSQRIAFSFFFVRLLSSLLLLPFLDLFVSLSQTISTVWTTEMDEEGKGGGEGRVLAVAFTLFNIFVGILWLAAIQSSCLFEAFERPPPLLPPPT
jgi:phosphate:Na+ symporter